ncbi:MAG: orotidine-5'-phosphate decarboxylase [Clostridia bacterium]|nr:orotidine-5'-phosphate decarboxylase [Clostridia bacterium]
MQNPSVVGLDPALSYLPMTAQTADSFEAAGNAILEFNKAIIDGIYDIVPAVKVQIAYYEMYGVAGMQAFYDTLIYAKDKGLIVMSDAKRNDIGSTASCYSVAYLGETTLGGRTDKAFPSDYLTVNPYLGIDGIEPFLKNVEKNNKGIFVLVKTSNPSSGELQDLRLESGETIYQKVGSLVSGWGKSSIGKYGYSSVGAVVGATHKQQAQKLRGEMLHTMFLVPGYGAQGGKAEDLTVCFDALGLGAIVNSSRGIICAYKEKQFEGLSVKAAARQAALQMKDDILSAVLKDKGIDRIGG